MKCPDTALKVFTATKRGGLQLRRNHGEGGEGLAAAVHVNSTKRDERLARATLRNDGSSARLIPVS
jgi:hypothetical protein